MFTLIISALYYTCRWYKRDDNAVPPVFTLVPVSFHLPDFICDDKDRKDTAKKQWWEESDAMQDAVELAATKVLGSSEAEKYVISSAL